MPRELSRRSMLAVGGLAAGTAFIAPTAWAATGTKTRGGTTQAAAGTPRAALEELLTGNRRFAAGHARHPRQTPDDVRRLATGQHPFAVVLGCADSRVPPEIVFDQGLGDVFADRVAGNIVDDMHLGSMEYAVEHLGPQVLVVLGHERCGAVTATVDAIEHGTEPPGHIAALVDALRPIVEPVMSDPGDKVDNGVLANIRAQARAVRERSEIVQAKVASGSLAVVGARYDLDTGLVTIVE